MNNQDDLFELVKTLSKSEKQSIRLHAFEFRKGKKNSYLKLFDVLDKMDVYDEKKLRIKFKNERFIKQLWVTKNYLHGIILKNLRDRRIHTGAGEMMTLSRNAQVLFEQGLFKQTKVAAKKLKDLAYEFDNQTYILRALQLERALMDVQAYEGTDEKKSEHLLKEEKEALAKYNNHCEYDYLRRQYGMQIQRKGMPRSHEDLEYFTKIMKHPLFQSEQHALTSGAKYIFYNFRGLYFAMQSEHEKSYQVYNDCISWMERNMVFAMHNPVVYIGAMDNMIIECILNKDYALALKQIEKVKQGGAIPEAVNNPALQARILSASYFNQLSVYTETGAFDKAMEVIKQINKGLKHSSGMIRPGSVLEINLSMSLFYFYAGEYQKVLPVLNRILNQKEEYSSDIQCYARILNLMVHFEMGNRELLEYAVQSAFRFLTKRKRLYKFERILLDFIRKEVPVLSTRHEQIAAFRRLLHELELLKKDPFENRPVHDFNIIPWLESKISGLTIQKILQKSN